MAKLMVIATSGPKLSGSEEKYLPDKTPVVVANGPYVVNGDSAVIAAAGIRPC